MLPTLHYFEIILRNRIDQTLKQYVAANWLIDYSPSLRLSTKDESKIEEIINKIRRERKREPSHDNIIAQLNFGFWCSFFHRKYDPILWHRKGAIKNVFPHFSRANRTRSYIEESIIKIKEIRNRIAHYEPIWNNKISVLKVHAICYELIGGMSQEAILMLNKIDRFPDVYQSLQH